MKMYQICCNININGRSKTSMWTKMLEQSPDKEIITGNWDNVEDFLGFDISLSKNKKGWILRFFDDSYWGETVFKQWKENITITKTYTYKEITPSLNEILSYYDSNKAIQYLLERGIQYINNN